MSETEKFNLSKEVHELILLIRGNPMDKDDNGMAGEVKALRDDIAKMKKRDNILYGIIIGMSFTTGMGIGKLIDLFT